MHATVSSAMSSLPLLLFISLLLSLLSLSLSQPPPPPPPPPRGVLIDCGATVESTIGGRRWLPDAGFVTAGTPKNLTVAVASQILSTVRSFPLEDNLHRKFCYTVRVFRGARYMVRTTYFYGGVNGAVSPPVFDQIVDGTWWSVVNTTENDARGMATYYEGVFLAQGSTMSLCIGANSHTDSDPFISALEFVILGDSLYNSTDFNQYGLSLVARNSFGHNESIRYPDDQFDRIWEPYGGDISTVSRNRNASVSGMWNLPPSKVFETEMTAARSGPLEFQWPTGPLPKRSYYIALYFADDRRDLSPGDSRLLDVRVNGVRYYNNLNVTPDGAVVFASQWPLDGPTNVTVASVNGSSAGPLINAGEVFTVIMLGQRTVTRDVIALDQVKSSLKNPPADWNGDPCMPSQYSWTGIKCSEGSRIRVVSLNLTSMGLSGSLSPSIAKLTALTDIWLGNNSLSGRIPDLGSLNLLQTLHLEDNQFSGGIPLSLGNIRHLHELFLHNNNLTGQIPSNLFDKPGLNLTYSGNQLSAPPPS